LQIVIIVSFDESSFFVRATTPVLSRQIIQFGRKINQLDSLARISTICASELYLSMPTDLYAINNFNSDKSDYLRSFN
jgi:hypothetical protein